MADLRNPPNLHYQFIHRWLCSIILILFNYHVKRYTQINFITALKIRAITESYWKTLKGFSSTFAGDWIYCRT